jgi:ankyrin repeat protein
MIDGTSAPAAANNSDAGHSRSRVSGIGDVRIARGGRVRSLVPALWRNVAVVALALSALASSPSSAQVPPTASEAAAYAGLHKFAHDGDLPQLRQTIAAGAALDARDGHGRTPLHVATFGRQREAIRELARAGANLGALENDRYDAVTIAAVADDEQTLALLLSLGASAKLVTSRYDGTALIAAAHLGHVGVVRRLIAAGAPLDHVNNLHWTAVIESIVLGDGGERHQQTLQALVDAGASTALADREGRTPLTLARSRGYTAMVDILERAGARR